MPHTVLLLGARLEFDSLEQFSTFLRLPVVGHYTVGEDGGGGGTFESTTVSADERERMGTSLGSLYRMVASPADVPDPWALARRQLAALRTAVAELEKVVAAGQDTAALFDTAEVLRAEAEELAFGVEAWDASDGIEPNAHPGAGR